MTGADRMLQAQPLADLLTRAQPPAPWHEGDNIPWHDPAFSARMLREHLSQAHDAASRRSQVIERQVGWIHAALLGGGPARVLDLGCGPGLYTSRLARLGHQCVGIDYGPASIEYACAAAARDTLECEYIQADLRAADFGGRFDLVMCIFGELNVFAPSHAAILLRKAFHALNSGGLLVLEAHTTAAVRAIGQRAPAWSVADGGLFSAEPYLLLEEHFWDGAAQAATKRFYVVDLAGAAMQRYAQSLRAYSRAQYRTLLRSCGFEHITFAPALSGAPEPDQPGLFVITARKPEH